MAPEKISFYDQASKNKMQSVLLIVIVFMGLIAIGWLIGTIFTPDIAYTFIIIAVIIAVLSTWVGYYYSDSIVLSATNAKPANDAEHKRVINLIEGLSIGSGMPMPRIYIIESSDINAFATGRNPEHAVIGVTKGALEKLNKDELEGVLAHELSHIRNYDILFMTLVATIVGMVVLLSEFFLRSFRFQRKDNDRGGVGLILIAVGIIFAVLAPFFMKLAQLAVSRRREYLADASAAEITRYPDGLAGALDKIKEYNKGRMQVSRSVEHLFISNPFKARGLINLFSTHPPIDERIKVLRAM